MNVPFSLVFKLGKLGCLGEAVSPNLYCYTIHRTKIKNDIRMGPVVMPASITCSRQIHSKLLDIDLETFSTKFIGKSQLCVDTKYHHILISEMCGITPLKNVRVHFSTISHALSSPLALPFSTLVLNHLHLFRKIKIAFLV